MRGCCSQPVASGHRRRTEDYLKHNIFPAAPMQRKHASSAPRVHLDKVQILPESAPRVFQEGVLYGMDWLDYWESRGGRERATRRTCVFVTMQELQPEELGMGWRVFLWKVHKGSDEMGQHQHTCHLDGPIAKWHLHPSYIIAFDPKPLLPAWIHPWRC